MDIICILYRTYSTQTCINGVISPFVPHVYWNHLQSPNGSPQRSHLSSKTSFLATRNPALGDQPPKSRIPKSAWIIPHPPMVVLVLAVLSSTQYPGWNWMTWLTISQNHTNSSYQVIITKHQKSINENMNISTLMLNSISYMLKPQPKTNMTPQIHSASISKLWVPPTKCPASLIAASPPFPRCPVVALELWRVGVVTTWLQWNYVSIFFGGNFVDGWYPANQLRLVVFPIIYRVSYIPGGAGFQPSTVVLDTTIRYN